jgi:hypothetical protein
VMTQQHCYYCYSTPGAAHRHMLLQLEDHARTPSACRTGVPREHADFACRTA